MVHAMKAIEQTSGADAFRILWPENRAVSADTMRGWYADAVANGEVERTDCTDVRDMARELHMAGAFTLQYGLDQ